MDILFFLLTVAALIMLIVSLVRPVKGLFFLKENQTRKKALLIYGTGFIITFVIFVNLLPDVPKTQAKQDTSIASDSLETENIEIILSTNEKSHLSNSNVIKWVKKKKKEGYIEDLIEGKWYCEYSIIGLESYEPELEKYNKQVTKKGESTFTYFFEDKNWSTPTFKHLFANFSTVNTPKEQFKQNGSYKIDGQILTIKSNTKVESYEVLFISKNVLIIKEEARIYVFSKEDATDLEDINSFFSYYGESVWKRIAQIMESYPNDIIVSENSLNKEISTLKKLNLVQADFMPDDLLDKVYLIRKQYEGVSDSILANKYSLVLNKNEYLPANEKYPVVESYIFKFEEVQNELLNLVASRKSQKMQYDKIYRVYETEFSKYRKMYKNYSIYGNGDKYLMESAAKDAIKRSMNDSKSFDFVEGWPTTKKTKSGWVYYIKFRGKNAYGGIVLNDRNVVLRFDPENGMYRAVDIY